MADVNEPPTTTNLPALLSAPTASTKQRLYAPSGEPSTEQLRELAGVWKAQRQEFPGWTVVPGQNRDNLWMLTSHWIEPVLAAAPELPVPDNLWLCYELNWRLERTLTPLFLPWAEAIAKIVEPFRPFPTVGHEDAASAVIRAGPPEHTELPWPTIREQWIELVFALAREAREDQDQGRFDKWMRLAEPALQDESEWAARWHCERCLFRLGCFDLNALREELEKWPQVPELPMWEARRAAILAELGDAKESERIARMALATVRARLRPFVNDYQILSQEGWIMLLLGGLSSDRAVSSSASRNRLDKLRMYHCNPWEHLEFLAPTLKGEAPKPKPFEQTGVAFEPRSRRVTQHFGQTPPHLLVRPAFALLRLYEEGAVPLRCGRRTIYLEEAVCAAKWVEPFAPLWSLGYRIRADKSDDLEAAFTRARVAGFDERQVADIYRVVFKALQQAVEYPGKNRIEDTKVLSFRLIGPLCQVLSKIVFKLDREKQDTVMSLFLQMYRLPLFARDGFVGENLIDTSQRMMDALPQEVVINRMGELLSLPIAGEGGFAVNEPRRWPEPLAHFKPDRARWQRAKFDRLPWDAPIQNLLRITREGSREGRSRAVVRLQVLGMLGALSDQERKGFGQALWSRLDPSSGLPGEIFLGPVDLFYLPSPERSQARKLLRARLLVSTFAPLALGGAESPGSRAPKDDADLVPDTDFALTLLNATHQPFAPPKHAKLFIDWTTEEATKFLGQAWDWWRKNKDVVTIDLAKAWWQDRVPSRQANALVDVIANVVLPRLRTASAETKQDALALLDNISETRVNTLRAEVAALIVASERAPATATRLRTALLNHEEESVWRGLVALGAWALHFAKGNTLAPPPNYLVDDLTGRILQRTPVALDLALDTMERICRRAPGLATKQMIDALVEALRLLIKETEYPSSYVMDDSQARQPWAIAEELRPECRQSAARLARTLYKRFNKQKNPVPHTLKRWQELCETDPLPEVRKAWSVRGRWELA